MAAVHPSILPPDDAVSALLAQLPRPARLLVAVSGGSDSLGLLLALARRQNDGIMVFAATVDHGLRPESAAEAGEVGRICDRLGVSHVTKAWTDGKPGSGIAAAAREARYRLLCEAADEVAASAILTAHTLDDQIETITMRAARNGDPSAPGLAGMAEAVLLHRRHWLLRPFLRTRRLEIRNFLQGLGQGWMDDPSNVDPRSERVRTRQALSRTSSVSPAGIEVAARHRMRVAQAAAEWLRQHAEVRHAVLMRVAPEGLAADPATLRYALSFSAAVLGGREQGPAADNLQRIVVNCSRVEPWRMTAGRVVFDRRRCGLYLCRETRDLPRLTLQAGETGIWDGRFRISNRGDKSVLLAPGEVGRERGVELFAAAPPSIAMRAAQAMPPCCRAAGEWSGLSCAPVLAPFDRFLPQFDYNLASKFAELFGCDNFPPAPFDDSVQKR